MSVTEITLKSSPLQDAIERLLMDAGIGEKSIEEILIAVEEAELSKAEADYDRRNAT